MRFFIPIVFSILLISKPSYAKWGKGELKLSKFTMENVLMYMYGAGSTKYSGTDKVKNDPMLMTISEDGQDSMYYYCPAQYRAYGCMDENTARQAILGCQKRSGGTPCFVFAIKRRVVWKNGGDKLKIKKKDLKSPYILAKKIQDAGFYDGDLSKLAGISVETGQIDESIKITGKDTTKSNTVKDKNSVDIVKELETLSKLFKSGVLSKEEFDKAKKKLLNN
jgi:hypothetical protein